MRQFTLLVAWLVLAAVAAFSATPFPQGQDQSSYVPVTKYDPKRDAAHDIEDAVVEAKRTSRRILLEVGGEWCSWCHRLDEFFESHPDLIALREKNFVTLKINFSEENFNREVLARYDPIPGYPHIFVLDANGKMLLSQGTSAFEEGRSYNLEKLKTFLTEWGPEQNQKADLPKKTNRPPRRS